MLLQFICFSQIALKSCLPSRLSYFQRGQFYSTLPPVYLFSAFNFETIELSVFGFGFGPFSLPFFECFPLKIWLGNSLVPFSIHLRPYFSPGWKTICTTPVYHIPPSSFINFSKNVHTTCLFPPTSYSGLQSVLFANQIMVWIILTMIIIKIITFSFVIQ